ncbi:EF-hand domain-containing family member C2 [Caerostris extrusa]|uniref:EF-hand domain-containing family member C2 n=1 Tax=Caerostris extrusa TaxID=172846 RepID=A0AAV4M3X2_CAEEX|nr:EF-hand domain-containing family member C2 [Caerostris extrusa]
MAHSNLRRMKVTMPHSSGWNEGRRFYEPTDFFLWFPHSNIKKITKEFTEWVPDKCEELKNGFEKYDPEKTGYINFDQFMEVMYEEMPNEIKLQYPEHAIRTVGRWYAEKVHGPLLP